jgi:hypothetical protein
LLYQKESRYQPGEATIDQEITSDKNRRFVLHDSKGFEPGDIDNLATAKRFIEERTGEKVAAKDRLHAIWYQLCTAYFS